MNEVKCAHCNKRIKKHEPIVVVDSSNYIVHDDCHIEYVLHCHLNTYWDSLEEYLEE